MGSGVRNAETTPLLVTPHRGTSICEVEARPSQRVLPVDRVFAGVFVEGN